MTRKCIKLSLLGFEKGDDDGLMLELDLAPVASSFLNDLLRQPQDVQVSDSWELDNEQLEKFLGLLRAYLTSGKCDFFIEERAFNEKQFGDSYTPMLDISLERSSGDNS